MEPTEAKALNKGIKELYKEFLDWRANYNVAKVTYNKAMSMTLNKEFKRKYDQDPTLEDMNQMSIRIMIFMNRYFRFVALKQFGPEYVEI